VVKTDVCAPTGDLPGRFCPKTTEEYFIPGKSPVKVSDIHREVLIDKATGLRACSYKEGEVYSKIYEFWPKEILTLFEYAGIKKKTIPNYVPNCDIEETSYRGYAPQIILPSKDVVYYIPEGQNTQSIPLKADADSDVKKLYWFIDGVFQGYSIQNKPLFVNLGAAKHTVQVVDDLGRHSSSYVEIVLQ
jgi:penicillin-binding protein 1C